MNCRSAFTIIKRPGFYCLADQGTGRSITNDAEAVIADLVRAGYDLRNDRVIYCDTRGVWDELLVTDGTFSGFESINDTELDAAIEKAIQTTATA
jgi:hypothetical protein